MWIQTPGKVSDRLTYLGDYVNGIYLLKGRDYMLIGGSMSWTVPVLDRQINAMDLDPRMLRYLFLSHSHFDHCGAVPYLKHRFPDMEIIASARAKDILSKEKAVSFISSANDRMVDEKGVRDDYERLYMKIEGFSVDRTVADGDSIDLGDGIQVRFMATPGHTECSFTAFVPALKALFPGDALPFPGNRQGVLSHPSPQYSYSAYKESVTMLAGLEPAILAYEHNGVMTDTDAMNTLKEGQSITEGFPDYIVALYRESGDMDKLVERIARESQERCNLGHLDANLRVIVAKAVCRSVLRDEGIAVQFHYACLGGCAEMTVAKVAG